MVEKFVVKWICHKFVSIFSFRDTVAGNAVLTVDKP